MSQHNRDYQRSKVYKWEKEFVFPKNKTVLSFENAAASVRAIFMAEGLRFPPEVLPIPPQVKTYFAEANRKGIWLPENTPTTILLHELAHSLTFGVDGDSDRHGPEYVGVYMTLLEKYAGINRPYLWYTATKAGVDYNPFAKPTITDS